MILKHKECVILNVKGNYCNDDIYVQLSEDDYNALVSTNIKKGVTILGVTGNLESTTTTVCTCDVPTIDNLEDPGENGKYYYCNGAIYVYNNGYKPLGETIPEVGVLPDTGQENDLVYCNNVLHKYIDNDWKELSVLEGEETWTPTHSQQVFNNKKKVTVNGVTVPNITATEFNTPTLSNGALVCYKTKIYRCTVQSDNSKQYVLYANKTEQTLTVPESTPIDITNAGVQKIPLPAPQAGSVYGTIGDVYINVDVEGVVIYEASETLPDGEDGEIVKHGDSYKLWQDSQWKELDLISNAETYEVVLTKDIQEPTGLYNKIVIPGVPIVPVTEFPENPTEDDLVYKDDKIYIYKSTQWVEYIKDTHTFDYETNKINYTVPNGLSAKEIIINGLKPEEVTASVEDLGEITPGFDPFIYDASTKADIDGCRSFTIKAVPVVDDGTLPKDDNTGKAIYNSLNEMRYYEGEIYKINSNTLKWELYEGTVIARPSETITTNGTVNREAPEGTTWNSVSFKVQVPSLELVKDYTSLSAASGLITTVGAIVHIPNTDDSGNRTWGTLYKLNEVGVWNPLNISSSTIYEIIEPTYIQTTIEAGVGDYADKEAFKSLTIAGVPVINWIDPSNLPEISVGQKIYMKAVSSGEDAILPNGLINNTIYQRGMNSENEPAWYPVKPLREKTKTIQRNTDEDHIDIVYNDSYTADAQLYGMKSVRVYLEGEKTCEVIEDYVGTYDTNAPLTHKLNDIPTFTATATDEAPTRISLGGKHIGSDIQINAYIPKINAIYTPKTLHESPTITAKELVSTSDIGNWTYKWWYADSITGEYKEYEKYDSNYKPNIKNVMFNKVTVDLSKVDLTGITLTEETINNILLKRDGYTHTPTTGIYYTKVEIPNITIPDCTDLSDPNLFVYNGIRVCFTGEYNGVSYDKTVMKFVEEENHWVMDTGNIQDNKEMSLSWLDSYTPDSGYDAMKCVKIKHGHLFGSVYTEELLPKATENRVGAIALVENPENDNQIDSIQKCVWCANNANYEWQELKTTYTGATKYINPTTNVIKLSDVDEVNFYEAVDINKIQINKVNVPSVDELPDPNEYYNNDNYYVYNKADSTVYKVLYQGERLWKPMIAPNGNLDIYGTGKYDVTKYESVVVHDSYSNDETIALSELNPGNNPIKLDKIDSTKNIKLYISFKDNTGYIKAITEMPIYINRDAVGATNTERYVVATMSWEHVGDAMTLTANVYVDKTDNCIYISNPAGYLGDSGREIEIIEYRYDEI